MTTQKLYQSRVQDIMATCNLQEPERVPVLVNVLTWAIGYAQGDTNELLDNPDKLPEVWTKFYEDVYCDATFKDGLSTPVRAIQRLGSDAFFVSSDKHTIQHKEHCFMEREDYSELIADALPFLIDVLGKRKFPELQKTDAEAYQALIDVALNIDKFSTANVKCAEISKEKYGVATMLGKHKVYPPFDVIFDRLRGIRGALTDLRRERANAIKAAEAIYPIYQKLAANFSGEFPYAQCTLHCPTYLSPKDFNEVFWPGMRDLIMEVYNRGSKTLLVMEGSWERHYDTLLELPQSSVLCWLEDDDIITAKKTLGQKFTLVGGAKTNTLRYGTKEQCIEEAKRVVDACAPGGGFIFSYEKALCTYGDVKKENLIAVNEFVHEYGKY